MPIPASLRPKISGLDDTIVRSTIRIEPDVGGVHTGNTQVTFRLPAGTILDLGTLRLHMNVNQTSGQNSRTPRFTDSVISRLDIKTTSGYQLCTIIDYNEIVTLMRSWFETDLVASDASWGARQNAAADLVTYPITVDGFRLGPLARNSQTPLWATDLLNVDVTITLADPTVIFEPGFVPDANNNNNPVLRPVAATYSDVFMTCDTLLFEGATYDSMIVAAKGQSSGFKMLYPMATLIAERGDVSSNVVFNERFSSRSLDAVLAVPKPNTYRQSQSSEYYEFALSHYQASLPDGARGSFVVNGHAMSPEMNIQLGYFNARTVIENLLPDPGVRVYGNAGISYFLGASLNAPRGRGQDGHVGSSGLNTFSHPGSITCRVAFDTPGVLKAVKLWAMHTAEVEISNDDMVRVTN